MSSSYKLVLLLLSGAIFVISLFFMNCSEDKLALSPTTSTSFTASATLQLTTTTISSTPTTYTYGACSRGICQEPFCEENCESPGKCHVKDVDGICYPSCGYLAQISEDGKYGGYGSDGQQSTQDDPHVLTSLSSPFCEDLEKWGVDDWRTIPLVENRAPFEIIEGNAKECCGSEKQLTR